MNVQNSAPSPENAQGNNQSWFEKIDFWQLVKNAVTLLRENRKALLVLGLYILFTGGQAISTGNLMLQSPPSDSAKKEETTQPKTEEISDYSQMEPESWEQVLKSIEQEEGVKSAIQEIVSNKEILNALFFFGFILAILLIGTIVAAFLMNSHFHLLYFGTLFALLNGQPAEREVIKTKMKGRWKKLSLMRLIFLAFYLLTVTIFFSPVVFFSSNEHLVNAFVGFSSFLTFATFVFISYVSRFSILYFAESSLSIGESIDRGYDLLRSKWKETLLASLINFAAGIVFGIFFILVFLTLGLIGGLSGLLLKSLFSSPLFLGLFIFFGLLLFFICIFGLITVWQCFILNFWALFFREIAGKKIISSEEASLLEKKKKLAELAVKKETDENLKNI